MFKVGIIGCGKIVELGHAPAFKRLAEEGVAKVVALADPVDARLEVLGDMLGVPPEQRYNDYQDMLKNASLDFVDVATPHFLHRDPIVAAAESGVNIISEKPLATNLAEVDDILEAVNKNGVALCVLHNYRYNPAVKKALQLIKEGALGEVFLIRHEGLGGGWWPGTESFDPNWRSKASMGGGGCLIDNGYHNLYLAREMMGAEVVSVYARIATYTQPIDVEDTALLLLEHANGGTTSIQVSWGVKSGGAGAHEIHGKEGSLFFGKDDKPLALFNNKTGEWSYPEVEKSPRSDFEGLFYDCFKAVEEGKPVPTDGQEARRNLAIIMAAYESSKTGKVIKLG